MYAADGTHPTGMHSCVRFEFDRRSNYFKEVSPTTGNVSTVSALGSSISDIKNFLKLIKTTSIWGLVFGVLVMPTLRFNSCITYGLPAGIPIHCYSYEKGEMVDVMLNLTETVQRFTPND